MESLKQLLSEKGCSLVVRDAAGEITFYNKKGVRDLIWILDNCPERLKGAFVADKVIGKAAAALVINGGVSEVYADVMSQKAAALLHSYGVSCSCGEMVDSIIIPEGDTRCPLEKIVGDTDDPKEAEALLREHFLEMKKDRGPASNPFFPEIKGRFGFGCMRLPMKKGEVDTEETSGMVDAFLESGFNYVDTAHGYLEGKSETALRECLTSRYPRDRYLLADKLTHGLFKASPEGIREFFSMQLEACGVEYFDFYLLHSQNERFFEDFKACRAYETVLELKAEGKIRHVGLSFHDRAEVLDRILTEYPQMEFVQIQLNYLDYDDPVVQSGLCYEVCKKHGKPVVVMEPVKGGNLSRLPEDCAAILEGLGTGASQASYALRYASSFPNVMMVLSGMSHLPQMAENISAMKDPEPITGKEDEALAKVRETFRSKRLIPCTACRYCTEGCPMEIPIPDLFADLNSKSLYKDWNSNWYFMVHTQGKGKPSDCIECGQCEGVCPQHLPIIDTLKKVAETFEK